MRRYFVQERGKKRRHSSATATVFNKVIGRKSEQIRAIYFVTTPKFHNFDRHQTESIRFQKLF